MRLNETITIQPPPNTDNSGKVVYPQPLTFSVLEVTYHDAPINKFVYATVKNIPGSITLLNGAEYDSAGDYTQAFIEDKLRQFLGNEPAVKLRSLFPKTLEENPNGPGTILAGMISAIGIKSTPTCSCRRHAIEMNEKGPDWCEANMSTILSWLKEESGKRSLPFVETVASLMVQRAINKSRRLLAKQQTAQT